MEILSKLRRLVGNLQVLAGLALVLSLAATIVAVFAVGDEAGSVATSALFVTIAGALQLVSAYLFSHEGKVPRPVSTIALRHLGRLARRAAKARELAESPNAGLNAAQLRIVVGTLSVELSHLEEDLIDAGENWLDAHPGLRATETEEPNNTGQESD